MSHKRLTDQQMLIGFLILLFGFFLSLAMVDWSIMHGAFNYGYQYPDWEYKYWMALGLVVVTSASLATWAAYASGMSEKRASVVFATVVLVFVAGGLDLFVAALAYLQGEAYSFDVWSAQYKWFGYWDWPRQIIWTAVCFAIIAYMWHKTRE
jgi:hypothetical protein